MGEEVREEGRNKEFLIFTQSRRKQKANDGFLTCLCAIFLGIFGPYVGLGE